MTAATATVPKATFIITDLGNLTDQERATHYQQVCDSLGLNSLTRPFEYIKLNGKLTLYAKKDCTEQLRKIHKVSISQLVGPVIDEGIVVFTAHAKDGNGRTDIATGAASIQGKGDDRANAIMKAETKAKRRVTLSLCGLGMLDETEVEPETTVFTTVESQAAPEPSSFMPVNEAPAQEQGERTEQPLDSRKPTTEELNEIKSRVAKMRGVLEDAGLQPSAGATTGTKLVRYFTKLAGATPKEMTIAQWNAAFATLNAMLEENVKEAVKKIEETIAG